MTADPSRVLIVRLGSLGDLIHTLPALSVLREMWPDAEIDWIVERAHAELLAMVPMLSRVVVLGERTAAGWWDVIRTLRARRYDVAIDLQGLVKSASLARFSGATRVAGFDRESLREPAARLFYTETIEVGAQRHVINKNLALVRGLETTVGVAGSKDPASERPASEDPEHGGRVFRPSDPAGEDHSEYGGRVFRPSDPAGEDHSEYGGRVFRPGDVRRVFPLAEPASPALAALRAQGIGDFAVVNPGAAWPNKRWPPESFAQVARAIHERYGWTPVVLWGPGEQSIAQTIVEASGGVARCAPPTALADLVAIARAAQLFVSGDTGPLHIAGATGTPIVALFGPTSPARNGPWDDRDVSISRYESCACHYKRVCQREGTWCLAEITVNEVLQAIAQRVGAA